MTRYSVQLRDRIFVKGYRFLCFAKTTGRNIDKKISTNLSSKYNLPQIHLKLLQKERFKNSITGDLIGNKIADKITTVSKTSPQHNSETNYEEILLRKICISRTKTKIY